MRDKRSASALPIHDLDLAERSLRARLAAYAMHAQRDSRETSAPGRAAFLARFERESIPTARSTLPSVSVVPPRPARSTSPACRWPQPRLARSSAPSPPRVVRQHDRPRRLVA
jgi:hypothetical protein